MSSNTLSIRVEGVAAVLHRLEDIGKALDTREILDQSAALLLHNLMDRFLRQSNADGQAFAPLSPKYAAAKQRKYNGGGILFASGKLFRSLQVAQAEENSRTIGTDVPYGKFHQFGTVKMPQREFLAFGDADVDLVRDYLVRRVTEAISA